MISNICLSILIECLEESIGFRRGSYEGKGRYILCFLGAGKLLMKKLINEGIYENIAIIENEFGEVSIDGEILRIQYRS